MRRAVAVTRSPFVVSARLRLLRPTNPTVVELVGEDVELHDLEIRRDVEIARRRERDRPVTEKGAGLERLPANPIDPVLRLDLVAGLHLRKNRITDAVEGARDQRRADHL